MRVLTLIRAQSDTATATDTTTRTVYTSPRFWVGGTGTWDTTTTTHWSLTSGGAGGASVPTSANDVIFDANSGGGTVTMSATGSARSFDTSGFSGTIAMTGNLLNVGDAAGGALTIGSGTTITGGGIQLISTSATTLPITTNGRTLSALTIVGGGKYQLAGALTMSSALTLTSGTFDTASFAVTAASFSSSNTNTRTLTLGSSAVLLNGTGTVWNATTNTGLTITPNTATITMSGAGVTWSMGGSVQGASLVFSGSGNVSANVGSNLTCANFTRTGTAVKTDSITFNGPITVTGAVTFNGNSATNRLLVQSSAVGTSRTVTAAAVSASNVDFMDIVVQGLATWTVGGTGGNVLSANQSNVETDLTGLAAKYGTGTVARSTAFSLQGGASMAATKITSTGVLYVGTSPPATIAVTPGQTVTAVLATLAATTPRSASVRIVWQDASGTETAAAAPVVTNSTDVWTWHALTAVAPAGTVAMNIQAQVVNVPVGETHYVDALGVWLDNVPTVDLSAIAGGSGDAGGNAGITFTPSVALYLRAANAGIWSTATNWSVTSSGGGAPSNGRVPLPQDDVILDAGVTLTGSRQIAADMPRLGRSIDCTGYLGVLQRNVAATLYGSFTASPTMTFGTGTSGWTFAGRGNYTIASAGLTWSGAVTITAPGGTYTLVDALSTTSTLGLTSGTLDTNDQPVTATTFSSNNTNVRSLILRTSTVTLTGTTGTIWVISNTGTPSFSGQSSRIVLTGAITGTATIALGTGLQYGEINYTQAGATGVLNFGNSAGIDILRVSGGRTVQFFATGIYTFRVWDVNGTAGNLVTVQSSAPGSTVRLKPTVGATVPFLSDYLSLTDTQATDAANGSGTGLWYAGSHSTDVSGNSGWIFSTPYFVTSGDTSPVSDGTSASVTLSRAGTDSATVTDAVVRAALALLRSSSNPAAATEAVARLLREARAESDTATATDTASRAAQALTRSRTESVPVTDAAASKIAAARAQIDAAPVNDSVVRQRGLTRAETEGAPVTDSTATGHTTPVAASDTATVTDSTARQQSAARAEADSAAAADTTAAGRRSARAESESAPAAETTAPRRVFGRSELDTAPAGDSTATRRQLHAGTSDTAPVTDSDQARVALGVTAHDTATVLEGTLPGRVLSRILAESVVAVDQAAAATRQGRTQLEVVPAADVTLAVLILILPWVVRFGEARLGWATGHPRTGWRTGDATLAWQVGILRAAWRHGDVRARDEAAALRSDR